MTVDALSMQSQLAKLRDAYADRLGARIDALAEDVRALANDEPGAAVMFRLEKVRMEAHKLVGSGATFGFPDITDIARAIEMACQQAIDGAAPCDAACIDTLSAYCVRLRDVLPSKIEAGWAEQESREIASARSGLIQNDDHQRIIAILDCDEEEAARMKREMANFGYLVHILADPNLLAAELANNVVDAVVSDLTFGGDTTRALEELGALKAGGKLKAPLVIYTDLDTIEARLGATRAGAQTYIVKPSDMTDLVNALDTMTDRIEAEPVRVLVIDDDESLARHTALVLEGAGMKSRVVIDPMKVLDVLDDFTPELILLDLYMPKCEGSEIAAVIRQRPEFTGIPIVFLSSEEDKEKQLQAMEMGGDDFLTKPIRPGHLISAVRIRARRFRELRSFMVRDSMTGLYNHTTAKQLMETEIARAKRTGTRMSLASLDIDHFKAVNDTYGHPVGDKVIKALARLLRQRLRGVDVIGRMGGEEFAAIMPDTAIDEAEAVFNEIRTAFSEIVFHADGVTFNVTISIGLAEFPRYDNVSLLSDAADKALYAAKGSGRDRVVKAG